LHQHRSSEYDQKGCRRHHFTRPKAREQTEHWIEQITPSQHQRRDCSKADYDTHKPVAHCRLGRTRGEERYKRE